jgi:hypothetical protein
MRGIASLAQPSSRPSCRPQRPGPPPDEAKDRQAAMRRETPAKATPERWFQRGLRPEPELPTPAHRSRPLHRLARLPPGTFADVQDCAGGACPCQVAFRAGRMDRVAYTAAGAVRVPCRGSAGRGARRAQRPAHPRTAPGAARGGLRGPWRRPRDRRFADQDEPSCCLDQCPDIRRWQSDSTASQCLRKAAVAGRPP